MGTPGWGSGSERTLRGPRAGVGGMWDRGHGVEVTGRRGGGVMDSHFPRPRVTGQMPPSYLSVHLPDKSKGLEVDFGKIVDF